jgi:hypothetical protein
MSFSFDLFTIVVVLVVVGLLTAAFQAVAHGNLNRVLKAALLLFVLLVGGVLVWNVSTSFQR